MAIALRPRLSIAEAARIAAAKLATKRASVDIDAACRKYGLKLFGTSPAQIVGRCDEWLAESLPKIRANHWALKPYDARAVRAVRDHYAELVEVQ